MGFIFAFFLASMVYYFIIGCQESAADEKKAAQNKAECDKFNAENEGVNFLYPRR